MLFASTFIFKMSREEFWSLTPRELSAYATEYMLYQERRAQAEEDDANGTSQPNQPDAVYIDQLW